MTWTLLRLHHLHIQNTKEWKEQILYHHPQLLGVLTFYIHTVPSKVISREYSPIWNLRYQELQNNQKLTRISVGRRHA